MDYIESKEFGNIGEEEILKRIIIKYPESFIDDTGKANSDWDIFVPEKNYGIEVKMDYKSKETGNLVIETEMNGKYSALSVTKSKYWVFITGFHYIWITPLEIYRFLELNPAYGRVGFVGTGDNSSKITHLPALHRIIIYVKSLDRKFGWIEEIKTSDPLYYYNIIKTK